MDIAKLNELIVRAHSTAVEKGWHETQHSRQHWVMLIITEVAEAVEAYRERGFESWFEGDKPCGVGSELADVAIRVFDFLGLLEDSFAQSNIIEVECGSGSFVEECYALICDFGGMRYYPIVIINRLLGLAKMAGVDLWEEVERKMAYNATRPYRHGDKNA